MKKIVKSLLYLPALAVLLFISCEKEKTVTNVVSTEITDPVTTNTVWAKGVYLINSEIQVNNCVLTIEPGTTIKFGPEGGLFIGYSENATLIAVGTASQPITFTSSATLPAAGAWHGIDFWWNNQSNSILEYCNIEYAGTDGDHAIGVFDSEIAVNHCIIKFSEGSGIEVGGNGRLLSFNLNTITDCAGHVVEIPAEGAGVFDTLSLLVTTETNKGILITSSVETNLTIRKATVPYILDGEIAVDNAILTIDKGTEFRMLNEGSFRIGYSENAKLIAIGTASRPIVFTSASSLPSKGDWSNINFWWNAQESDMEHCILEYGGKDGRGMIEMTGGVILSMSNCTMRNSEGYAVKVYNGCTLNESNNSYSNNTLGNVLTD